MRHSKEPRLFGRDFNGGWYELTNLRIGSVMRGMTKRVRGGILSRSTSTVTFWSGRVVSGSGEGLPDLDTGIMFGLNYDATVQDGVAHINGYGIRSKNDMPYWTLKLYLPSPCPPWEHPPIRSCGCAAR